MPTPESTTPPWIPQNLYPYRPNYMELGGHRVHYVDEGSGPPLILLHGNPTWSFLYRRIIETLKSRFRCIAPDYPGFGLSTAGPGYNYTPASHAQVILRFLEKLELKNAYLMGQDWGGPIGLWAASRMPQMFRGIILGNTWAWPVNGDPHFEMFSWLWSSMPGRFLVRWGNMFVNSMLPMGTTSNLPSEVMAAYRGPFPTKDSRNPTWIFPREITNSKVFLAQVEGGLYRLKEKPALLVWGDRDPAFRQQERERLAELFPNSKTVVLRGAGHFIQEDAPAAISTAIRDFADVQEAAAKAAAEEAAARILAGNE